MPPPGSDGRPGLEDLVAADPTGWFEHLYAAARRGAAVVPWDRASLHWMLQEWADARRLDGGGRRALVVGCGLGADAEFMAGLGFATIAFDISATAIGMARDRYPDSAVDYRVADLLNAPEEWRWAFDLVLEIQTVQSLPDPPRAEAIARVGELVAPGGTLLVICLARGEEEPERPRPPFAITRTDIGSFARDGLTPVRIDEVAGSPQDPLGRRWRAEFHRPVTAG